MKTYTIRALVPWHRGQEMIPLVAVPTNYLNDGDIRVMYVDQHMTIQSNQAAFLVRSQVDKYSGIAFSLSYFKWIPDRDDEWIHFTAPLFNNGKKCQIPKEYSPFVSEVSSRLEKERPGQWFCMDRESDGGIVIKKS